MNFSFDWLALFHLSKICLFRIFNHHFAISRTSSSRERLVINYWISSSCFSWCWESDDMRWNSAKVTRLILHGIIFYPEKSLPLFSFIVSLIFFWYYSNKNLKCQFEFSLTKSHLNRKMWVVWKSSCSQKYLLI